MCRPTSHDPIFKVDAGKFDALSLSWAAEPVGAKHFPILDLANPWAEFSDSADGTQALCCNCKEMRSNSDGVFFKVRPKGLGSSKGLQGAEGTETGVGGSIWWLFLSKDGWGYRLLGSTHPSPLTWSSGDDEKGEGAARPWLCDRWKKAIRPSRQCEI